VRDMEIRAAATPELRRSILAWGLAERVPRLLMLWQLSIKPSAGRTRMSRETHIQFRVGRGGRQSLIVRLISPDVYSFAESMTKRSC
jgi:hypothetical protein